MSKNVRKLECEEAIQKLLEYLDHELDGHDHDAMHEHLHTCRSCYTRMEFEQQLKGMVKETEEQAAPDSLRNRIRKISDKF